MKKLAILKTLHYADIFDYPLTAGEIKNFLGEPADITFEEVLTQMSADPPSLKLRGASSKLIFAGEFYCLPGRGKIIELRKKRQVWSRPKLEKAKRVVSILKLIPWIKLIGVTGALALENSDEDDDIDLMIITAPRRLWLTRGLVVTFLLLTGQYRRPGKIKDRICPNLTVSEDALEFPDRDLFTAHEIVQMKPIFERDNTYQKFIDANHWVFDFLPNWKPNITFANRKSLIVNRPQQFSNLTIKQFSFIEKLVYKLQIKYMERKKTTEITTPSTIRFHPQDTRRRVLDEYQKRVYTLPK